LLAPSSLHKVCHGFLWSTFLLLPPFLIDHTVPNSLFRKLSFLQVFVFLSFLFADRTASFPWSDPRTEKLLPFQVTDSPSFLPPPKKADFRTNSNFYAWFYACSRLLLRDFLREVVGINNWFPLESVEFPWRHFFAGFADPLTE